MFKSSSLTIFSLLLTLNVSASKNSEQFFSKLNKAELKKVFEKETILKTEKIKKAPWPLVRIYGIINSTPLEAIAVYAAYDQQKVYTPDLIISKPIKQVTPTDVHVQYERHMPWPLSNVRYITGNKIKKIEAGGLELSWYQVESINAKVTKGKVRFFPYKGATLLEYENFLHPTSFFASFLKETMLTDVKFTLDSIINYIENVKENPKKMEILKKRITDALSGKFVY